VSEKARKLLERMRQSAANWTRNDLDKLYEGFGFEIRHGSKHDIVKHPDYPQLRATLPRHTTLAKAYVRTAVKLIDELESLLKKEYPEKEGEEDQPDDE
jgi:hypothetical protein